MLAPEYGFFVRATTGLQIVDPDAPVELPRNAQTAREFKTALSAKGYQTIRQRTQAHPEQSWDGAMQAMFGDKALPAIPAPGLFIAHWDGDHAVLDPHISGCLPFSIPDYEPAMKIEVPCDKLTAQWKLGMWHILRSSHRQADGAWSFNDFPFGILAAETYMILRALDLQGAHTEAADGLRQWLRLPMEHQVLPGIGPSHWQSQHSLSLPDRPLGNFADGIGCLTLAEGPAGRGGHMDGVHAMGPGAIMYALAEHYCLTGDVAWLRAHAPRMKANIDWILRQRQLLTQVIPGGKQLWSAGLQPAHVMTPDSKCMRMQYYESEAYYWLAVKRMAAMLSRIDPAGGAAMEAEAEMYQQDLIAAIERSIALTPVMQVLDGTYHSFIPFAPYVRGLAAGAWGWTRCQGHIGATYWDTVQSSDPLIDPSHLLATDDPRVQGHLDVLEDRLLISNHMALRRKPDFDLANDWFGYGSWQYQCGLERHANIHLQADDAPSYIRTLLNQYAVDIMPDHEYRFHEHTTLGPDKIYEESCFLERFRMMLVREEGDTLWLAKATPRAWLEQEKTIAVKDAPTHFGTLGYEITSDVDHGKITATLELPERNPPARVCLRLRHPQSSPITSVTVNGMDCSDFDAATGTIILEGLHGSVGVTVNYC